MNRQILGTMALLTMLATVQTASGQYAPMPGPGAQRVMPAMMPPTARMPGPMGQYGAGPMMAAPTMPGAMMMPGQMTPGPMGPMPGAMPGPMGRPMPGAMPGPMGAMPGPMGRPMPGAMPGPMGPMPGAMPGPMGPMPGAMPGPMGRPMPGAMPGPMMPRGVAPPSQVQPAYYQAGPQAAQSASYSGCDAGCDGCDSCGGGGLLAGLSGGCGLFGTGCGDGCGGGGCGGFGNHLHQHGPSGTGGCCLPRWFDFQAEWLYWNYEFSESLALTSRGILGPTVLDTDQLSMNYESGYRVTGAYLIGPGTAVEAGYMGGLNWSDHASVTGNNDLFSVFSDFGTIPLNGFPETDFGSLHTVSLSAEMNGAEVNLRRRWISANCHIHSSLLVGARYFRWREDMVYETFSNSSQSNPDGGEMSYRLKASNDLVGAQTGGDVYFCITPRFKIGADIKAGVYGTHSTSRTDVFCTTCDPLRELESVSDVAFLGEGGAVALYRVTPRLTFRTVYQVLYVDGIATAAGNFNTQSPFSARDTFIDHEGNAFVHGANVGFEWTW